MRRLNVRILALALILVFTQKLGLRLWMHAWLHETKALSTSHEPSIGKLQCDCIDDFLMPMTGSAVIEAPQPNESPKVEFIAHLPFLYSKETPHASRRGPPSSPIYS